MMTFSTSEIKAYTLFVYKLVVYAYLIFPEFIILYSNIVSNILIFIKITVICIVNNTLCKHLFSA